MTGRAEVAYSQEASGIHRDVAGWNFVRQDNTRLEIHANVGNVKEEHSNKQTFLSAITTASKTSPPNTPRPITLRKAMRSLRNSCEIVGRLRFRNSYRPRKMDIQQTSSSVISSSLEKVTSDAGRGRCIGLMRAGRLPAEAH